MMQQVAKVLLDSALSDAKRNGGRVAPPPPPPSPPNGNFGCVRFLLALAKWREAALVSEVAADMFSAAARAASASGGNKGAIAEASALAYDARMDDAVEIGWARADAETLAALADAAFGVVGVSAGDEINGASPAAARPALKTLAVVHGTSVALRSAAVHLSRGALCPRGFAALREARNAACSLLCSGGEDAPALKLADGFGIPEHLIAAPIATGDWRKIGEGLGK